MPMSSTGLSENGTNAWWKVQIGGAVYRSHIVCDSLRGYRLLFFFIWSQKIRLNKTYMIILVTNTETYTGDNTVNIIILSRLSQCVYPMPGDVIKLCHWCLTAVQTEDSPGSRMHLLHEHHRTDTPTRLLFPETHQQTLWTADCTSPQPQEPSLANKSEKWWKEKPDPPCTHQGMLKDLLACTENHKHGQRREFPSLT